MGDGMYGSMTDDGTGVGGTAVTGRCDDGMGGCQG